MPEGRSRTHETIATREELEGGVRTLEREAIEPAAGDGGRSDATHGELLEALRRRVTTVESENLRLERVVERLRGERLRTPDDLAAAVSHSLDSLQANLAEVRNPVSQFAVREMSIEASVHLSISPLGTLEYRFVELGEEVPPASLSKIRMTLVPLPREEPAPAAGRVEPLAGVETLVGVEPALRRKLYDRQIYTIADLRRAGTRVRSRAALAAMVGVDRERLGGWLRQAELMTVEGIDGRAAAGLDRIGIHSLADLARAEPGLLVERFGPGPGEGAEGRPPPLDLETAKRWVETAAGAVRHRREAAPESRQP